MQKDPEYAGAPYPNSDMLQMRWMFSSLSSIWRGFATTRRFCFIAARGGVLGTCLSCSQHKSVGAPIKVLPYWTSPVDVFLPGLPGCRQTAPFLAFSERPSRCSAASLRQALLWHLVVEASLHASGLRWSLLFSPRSEPVTLGLLSGFLSRKPPFGSPCKCCRVPARTWWKHWGRSVPKGAGLMVGRWAGPRGAEVCGTGAGKAPWCMMSFLPVPGWGCRAAVGPSGHGVMVSAADGPVAQYHPVRADSFHLASLNPTVWVLGAQAMQKRLRSFLSSPNTHQELKKFCNECDVQLGLQVSGPCCMLKGDSGGLGVGNVVRWRVTSFKMQMWVRNWKDTVTRHVYSCRDTLESQTKVVLRQQLHSVEALGNPSQDQERAFV